MHRQKIHKSRSVWAHDFVDFPGIKGSKICPRMVSDTWIDMIRTKQKLSNHRLGFESKMLISKAETNIYDPKVGSGRGSQISLTPPTPFNMNYLWRHFQRFFITQLTQIVTKFVLIYFLILVSAVYASFEKYHKSVKNTLNRIVQKNQKVT